MKLLRFGPMRQEKPGVELPSGKRLDLSKHFEDWDHNFFADSGLLKLERVLADHEGSLPEVDNSIRLGSPVARPRKLLGIGLNYSDHAAETGMELPKEPLLFMKGTNTVVGPHDQIVIPSGSDKTDWEVEVAVVICKDAKYIPSADAAVEFIAGYCVSHDVSERGFQLERSGQWTKGKSCDTFNPLGPYLVTCDEIPNPNDLSLWLTLNGEQMQHGNTRTMVFAPNYIVYYLSQFMTLEAGDVITTGTPPGVGLGRKPQRYLKPGDVVELAVSGLGQQRQECIAEFAGA